MKINYKYILLAMLVLIILSIIYFTGINLNIIDLNYINLLATIVLVCVTSIYTYQTTKHVRGDLGPKLYIVQEQLDADMKYENMNIPKERIRLEDRKEIGFSNWLTNNTNWKIKLFNNGRAPATDVMLKLTLKFYKTDFELGIDEADVLNERERQFYEEKIEWKVDYLPPETSTDFELYIESHRCRSVKLFIDKLHSNENTYLSRTVHLSTLYHDGFDSIADSHESRRIIGVYGPWEDCLKP